MKLRLCKIKENHEINIGHLNNWIKNNLGFCFSGYYTLTYFEYL